MGQIRPMALAHGCGGLRNGGCAGLLAQHSPVGRRPERSPAVRTTRLAPWSLHVQRASGAATGNVSDSEVWRHS
jgi:hypothetical protein